MNNIWFKRKKYGWGWTPVTWQGWATLILYIILMVWIFNIFPLSEKIISKENFLPLALWFDTTVILVWISYKKGESPKWQWGEDK